MKSQMRHNADYQMAQLSIFVHGVLTAFHCLGIIYNAKRRNWIDVAAHSGAAVYDLYAVSRHVRQVGELSLHDGSKQS